MNTALEALAKTPLPTVLVLAGIAFLFLAVGGQLGARVSTRRLDPRYALMLGVLLLGAGIAMYFVQARSGTEGLVVKQAPLPTITPPSPEQQKAPDAVRLRGADRRGMTTEISFRMEMRKAVCNVDSGGTVKRGTADTVKEERKRHEIVAVENGEATLARTKVITDRQTVDYTFDGKTTHTEQPGPLEGESYLNELKNGFWVRTLEGTQPSPAQAEELRERHVNSDSILPDGKIPPGYSWQLKDQQLAAMVPGALSVTGRGSSTFTGTQQYAGEPCAVIRSRVEVAAKLIQNNNPAETTMGFSSITYRSLAKFLDLRTETEGNITMKMSMYVENQKADVEIIGPFRQTITTRDLTDASAVGLLRPLLRKGDYVALFRWSTR